MDFFQFLQNSKNETSDTKIPKTKTQRKTIEINKMENKTGDEIGRNNEDITLYNNIQRGDFVKIVYLKGSLLNSYKGYIGEIRDYKKDQDSALVLLHAISSHCVVKFPLQHFYKIN